MSYVYYLLCHLSTTIFVVPISCISEYLFKFKVAYCVGGVTGLPCGTPRTVRTSLPFTTTPARRYLPIRRRSPLSLTRRATRLINTSKTTESKNLSRSMSTGYRSMCCVSEEERVPSLERTTKFFNKEEVPRGTTDCYQESTRGIARGQGNEAGIRRVDG